MKQTNGQSRSKMGRNRNSSSLHPVQVEAAYLLRNGRRIVEKGRTRTVGISRTELALDAAQPLPRGTDIELILNWPAPVGSQQRLAVRIKGRTLANGTTVKIAQYDFEVLPERIALSDVPSRSASKERAALPSPAILAS